ncbi:MAG: spore germination protein [Alicyclobacillus herbarius]|uniref:GerAB/ArcD/ProY family transporter n=1 Tax=Alicyclobacillus herbarius TaxID=122960 RepID=UPI00235740A7|nr:endospore germination permease [Alicyclobacillus herbarius]MCL6633927.1 spore germination protein [Alicyclobacillus herbarius]
MHQSVYRTITVIEAVGIVVSSCIGVGILALPRIVVEAVDTGAPVLTFFGLCLSLAGLFIITLLAKRFPNDTIVRVGERVMGVWVGRVMGLLITTFYIVLVALVAREFSTVVVTVLLPKTPIEVTTAVLLILAALSIRNNITTFAYIHLFYQPFIHIPAFAVSILALKYAIPLNLLPLVGNGNGHWLIGTLSVAALLQGGFVMAFLSPAMIEPHRIPQVLLWSGILISGIFMLTVVAPLAVFGSMEIRNMMWPTLELAKIASIPGEVLERLDVFFLAIWVTAVFSSLYSMYFISALAIKDVLRFEDHSFLSFALLPIVFTIAMLPPNIVQLYRVITWVGWAGLALTIGYPSLVLAVSWLRRIREERIFEKADGVQ